MPYEKTILCLAHSRKQGGVCIAGKEINGTQIGGWIRPVSTTIKSRSEIVKAVSRKEQHCDNHQDSGILDVIQIQMIEPQMDSSCPYQSENHLIDSNQRWRKTGRKTWQEALTAVDNVKGPLWLNDDSSGGGKNDRVPENKTPSLRNSLYLIKPSQLKIHAQLNQQFGKKQVRASFHFNDADYNLSVKDSIFEPEYKRRADDVYPIDEALLCISLGGIYRGFAYKLVAGVITPAT